MYKIFKFSYKETKIIINIETFREQLFVNNELQDECIGFAFRSRMSGSIHNNDNTIDKIKVSAGAIFKTHCTVFINDKLIFRK
jgi:hypothetical protein